MYACCNETGESSASAIVYKTNEDLLATTA